MVERDGLGAGGDVSSHGMDGTCHVRSAADGCAGEPVRVAVGGSAYSVRAQVWKWASFLAR